MEKLIIVREKWGRGNGEGRLLDYDGKMCCLGFYALQNGCSDDDINGRRCPSDVEDAASKFPKLITTYCKDNAVCARLMDVNDRINDEAREQQLIELFKLIDIEAEFV